MAIRPRLLTSPPPAVAPWIRPLGGGTTPTAVAEGSGTAIGGMTATDMVIGAAGVEAEAVSALTVVSLGIWLGIALTEAGVVVEA